VRFRSSDRFKSACWRFMAATAQPGFFIHKRAQRCEASGGERTLSQTILSLSLSTRVCARKERTKAGAFAVRERAHQAICPFTAFGTVQSQCSSMPVYPMRS